MAVELPEITVTPTDSSGILPDSSIGNTFGTGRKSFVQRLIDVQVTLSKANTAQISTFVGTDSNSIKLSKHRTSVRISNAGTLNTTADIAIFGLNQTILNQLSQIGRIYDQVQRNTVTVSAGDAINGMTPVFGGTALDAYADYSQMPEVPMIFHCLSGGVDAVANAAPSSFSGVTDVATLMSGYATAMGLRFENNGVNVKLSSPYFGGSILSQIKEAAEHAFINAEIINNTTLAIWPKGKSRTSLVDVPLLSASTGMIGYPAYSTVGKAIVKHIFNPLVHFGGNVQIESSIPLKKRTWTVTRLDLALDSLVPDGDWMGIAHCYPEKIDVSPPPGGLNP